MDAGIVEIVPLVAVCIVGLWLGLKDGPISVIFGFPILFLIGITLGGPSVDAPPVAESAESNAPTVYETVKMVQVNDDNLHDYDILKDDEGRRFLRVRKKETGEVVSVTKIE